MSDQARIDQTQTLVSADLDGQCGGGRPWARHLRWSAAGVAMLLFAIAGSSGIARAGEQTATQSEPGVWRTHQLTFNYLGISPRYSCSGLKDTLDFLLRQSGARLDKPVQPGPCVNGFGSPEPLPYARLNFSTLAPAGQATTGGAGSGNAEAVQGSWHRVVFSPTHSAPTLGGGDCELVEQFQNKILPLLDVRNVKSNLHCVPHQTIGYSFSLSFEVFAPANTPPRQIGGG